MLSIRDLHPHSHKTGKIGTCIIECWDSVFSLLSLTQPIFSCTNPVSAGLSQAPLYLLNRINLKNPDVGRWRGELQLWSPDRHFPSQMFEKKSIPAENFNPRAPHAHFHMFGERKSSKPHQTSSVTVEDKYSKQTKSACNVYFNLLTDILKINIRMNGKRQHHLKTFNPREEELATKAVRSWISTQHPWNKRPK